MNRLFENNLGLTLTYHPKNIVLGPEKPRLEPIFAEKRIFEA